MTWSQFDARGKTEHQAVPAEGGRARRLMRGWSANLAQVFLALTQQILLVPVFLHFWTGETLAAWLAIYAAGSLAVVADAGLQLHAINRFLAFKAYGDCDSQTADYYAGLLRIYLGIDVLLGALLVVGAAFLSPSRVLGFHEIASFDASLLVMIVGMLLTLPANLVSGLYRARGNYGRAVWLQNAALLAGQIAQFVAIAAIGSLVAVAVAFVATQLLLAIYLVAWDAPRLFPFLRGGRGEHSWRWALGQFGPAFPFAVANLSELVLANAPVLLVSALVSDRVGVAQWGLTRVIAGFVRGLSFQTTLPIAAELGHDYAIGDKERLRRLYAYGSVFVTAVASVIVAGLLPFWPDFFMLWTHGSIPYNAPLAYTLLLGSAAVAPSLLALAYASHSSRGDLLVRTKGLQLVVFLVLSVVMIRWLGSLGAALALVASDLSIQFGLLGSLIIGESLRHPLRHVAALAVMAVAIVLSGWVAGAGIASIVPGIGLPHFVAECTIWLMVAGTVTSPLLNRKVRERLTALIPT